MKASYSLFFTGMGIISSVFFPHTSFSLSYILLPLLLSMLLGALFYVVSKKYTKILIFSILFFFSLSISAFSLFIFENNKEKNILQSANTKVSFSAVISEYPTFREEGVSYVLKPQDPEKLGLSPHTLLLYKGFPGDVYGYGQVVEVEGVLKRPYEKDKTGEDSYFSYRKFLEKDSIFFTIEYGSIKFISEGEKSFQRYLYGVRDYLKKPIEKNIQGDEGGLTLGVLLGEKKAMSSQAEEIFSYTGLSHIVVLSGYNISLLAEYSLKFFGFVGFAASHYLTGGLLLLFVLMVGGGATAWRAFLMTAILLFARKTGNFYSGLHSLLWAGFLMSLYNPYMTAFDPSFHLSFLATLGILLYGDFFKSFLLRFLKFPLLSDILSTTYAATLFVAPYLLFWMHKISLVSLVSNIVVLPLVPILMFSGVFFIIISLLFPTVSPLFSFVVFFPAWIILFLAKLFSYIPGGGIELSLSLSAMLLLYSLILYHSYFLHKNHQ